MFLLVYNHNSREIAAVHPQAHFNLEMVIRPKLNTFESHEFYSIGPCHQFLLAVSRFFSIRQLPLPEDAGGMNMWVLME